MDSRIMKTYTKFPLLTATVGMSVLAFSLAGCAGNGPSAMPTGYKYHSEVYKSPNPPPTPKLTTKQRKYMDVEQAEQFRDGVYELLVRITDRAGMPPKPVYILRPEPMTAFYANIDNDLRESMRSIGYVISDTPENAYVFSYDATIIGRSFNNYVNSRGEKEQISSGEPNVALTLKIFNGAGSKSRMLTHETGRFFIKGAELLHIEEARYNLLPTADSVNNEDRPAVARRSKPVMAMPNRNAEIQMMDMSVESNMTPMAPTIEIDSYSAEPLPLSAQVPLDMPPPSLQAQQPIVAEYDSGVEAYIDENGTLQEPDALGDNRPTLGTSMTGKISKPLQY